MKIALVTYRDSPKLPDGEKLLFDELHYRGHLVDETPWDDPQVNWLNYDRIVLRASWNYHEHIVDFKRWLTAIRDKQLPLWNPIETVLWNIDKHYLKYLSSKGVNIIPTVFVEEGEAFNTQNILLEIGSSQVIVKPAYGASAFGVNKFATTETELIKKKINDLQTHSAVMIQKFLPEISQGELSLIFFNKVYCHSALKTPSPTDYRTQPHFGGTEAAFIPTPEIIMQAQKIINTVQGSLLYARVDGININGVFHLMELELVEPYLFLEQSPDAPKKFADAIENINC